MCKLQTCCCGCSLETGTFLIGIYSGIQSLLIAGVGVWLIVLDGEEKRGEQGTTRYDSNQSRGLGFMGGLGVALIVIGAIAILITALLFVGVQTKRSGYLLAWLVANGVYIGLCTLGVLGSFLNGNMLQALLNIAVLTLDCYLWSVVNSFYHLLRQPTGTVLVQASAVGVIVAGTGDFAPVQHQARMNDYDQPPAYSPDTMSPHGYDCKADHPSKVV